MLPIIDKIHEAEELEKEGKVEDAKRVMGEADAMFAAFSPPDELGRNVDNLVSFLNDPELAEKPMLDVTGVMAPHFRGLVTQYLANYEANNTLLAELKARRSQLVSWANFATYAAISLQLFGLFFFFAKDLAKEEAQD